MAVWRESFKGNRMSSKWSSTRQSMGGQNDGVWSREIRDGKLYAVQVSKGTETDIFGERLSLRSNWTGDVVVRALLRQKYTGGAYGNIAIGFNEGAALDGIRNGGNIRFAGTVYNWIEAKNNGTFMYWPSWPIIQLRRSQDYLSEVRLVRSGGRLQVFIEGYYVGSFAFSATISTIDLVLQWDVVGGNLQNSEKWVHDISVWPKEAVL